MQTCLPSEVPDAVVGTVRAAGVTVRVNVVTAWCTTNDAGPTWSVRAASELEPVTGVQVGFKCDPSLRAAIVGALRNLQRHVEVLAETTLLQAARARQHATKAVLTARHARVLTYLSRVRVAVRDVEARWPVACL